MGKTSRTKGKVWERAVADALRTIYGAGVKRGWQAREGSDAPDVDGTPWWNECKHAATMHDANPFHALAQAEAAKLVAMDNRPAVAFCKLSSKTKRGPPPLVAMSMPTWLNVLDELMELKKFREADIEASADATFPGRASQRPETAPQAASGGGQGGRTP